MPCSKLEVSTVQHGTLSGAGYSHQSPRKRELATTVCDEWGASIRRALGGYVGLGGTPFSSGGTLL
jgi:hypothetical protein